MAFVRTVLVDKLLFVFFEQMVDELQKLVFDELFG